MVGFPAQRVASPVFTARRGGREEIGEFMGVGGAKELGFGRSVWKSCGSKARPTGAVMKGHGRLREGAVGTIDTANGRRPSFARGNTGQFME